MKNTKLRSNRPNPKLQQRKVRQKSPDANINVSNELNVYKATFIINNSFQPDAANTSINSLVKEIFLAVAESSIRKSKRIHCHSQYQMMLNFFLISWKSFQNAI